MKAYLNMREAREEEENRAEHVSVWVRQDGRRKSRLQSRRGWHFGDRSTIRVNYVSAILSRSRAH